MSENMYLKMLSLLLVARSTLAVRQFTTRYLSIYLFIYLSIYLFIYLSFYQHIFYNLSIYMSTNLYIFFPGYLSVCLNPLPPPTMRSVYLNQLC